MKLNLVEFLKKVETESKYESFRSVLDANPMKSETIEEAIQNNVIKRAKLDDNLSIEEFLKIQEDEKQVFRNFFEGVGEDILKAYLIKYVCLPKNITELEEKVFSDFFTICVFDEYNDKLGEEYKKHLGEVFWMLDLACDNFVGHLAYFNYLPKGSSFYTDKEFNKK